LTPAGRAAYGAVSSTVGGLINEAKQRQAELGAFAKPPTFPERTPTGVAGTLSSLGLFGGWGPGAQKYRGPGQEPPTGGLLSKSLEEQFRGSPLARDAGLNDIRATIDQSFGSSRGGGTTEGTITIEHQESGRSGPRKVPLFRAPHIARQSQMQPAEHGPENHWSNSQDVVH
jgi:hypothetical protein